MDSISAAMCMPQPVWPGLAVSSLCALGLRRTKGTHVRLLFHLGEGRLPNYRPRRCLRYMLPSNAMPRDTSGSVIRQAMVVIITAHTA